MIVSSSTMARLWLMRGISWPVPTNTSVPAYASWSNADSAAAGLGARQVDGVDRDRRGLGERGGPRRQRFGDAEQSRSRDDLVAAERAVREVEQVGRLTPQAYRRAAAPARAALAATGRGVLHDARADLPSAHVGADRGDRARPFVAEDAVRAGVLLEHEVQVGAADAAVG